MLQKDAFSQQRREILMLKETSIRRRQHERIAQQDKIWHCSSGILTNITSAHAIPDEHVGKRIHMSSLYNFPIQVSFYRMFVLFEEGFSRAEIQEGKLGGTAIYEILRVMSEFVSQRSNRGEANKESGAETNFKGSWLFHGARSQVISVNCAWCSDRKVN